MEHKNLLDLFSGCGGFSFGFHKLGFNIVCANELEKEISNTYTHNFPNSNVIVGDITKKEIKNNIYSNFNDKKCHVIIGGPPCVAYSLSGNRDPRDTRGELFKDYIEIVKKLKPEICVIENVKGILNMYHDKENLNKAEKIIANNFYKLDKQRIDLQSKKKHNSLSIIESKKLEEIKKELKIKKNELQNIQIKVPDKITEAFNKIGYDVEYKLFNTASYGVPQKRERVIFIAIRNNTDLKIQFPKETHNKNQWISVKESIDDLKNLENNLEFSHIITNHNNLMLNKIKNTPIGSSANPKYKEAWFKCYPNQPSNTVKENHGGVFLHYEKNRCMTPRELARLQSFPDHFIFKGSKSSQLKQIGNAVPCLFAERIAENIKKIYQN